MIRPQDWLVVTVVGLLLLPLLLPLPLDVPEELLDDPELLLELELV